MKIIFSKNQNNNQYQFMYYFFYFYFLYGFVGKSRILKNIMNNFIGISMRNKEKKGIYS